MSVNELKNEYAFRFLLENVWRFFFYRWDNIIVKIIKMWKAPGFNSVKKSQVGPLFSQVHTILSSIKFQLQASNLYLQGRVLQCWVHFFSSCNTKYSCLYNCKKSIDTASFFIKLIPTLGLVMKKYPMIRLISSFSLIDSPLVTKLACKWICSYFSLLFL